MILIIIIISSITIMVIPGLPPCQLREVQRPPAGRGGRGVALK